MNDLLTEKSSIRALLRARRQAFVRGLSPAERALSFSAIPSAIKQLLHDQPVIGSYCSTSSEAPTYGYHKHLTNKLIALPYFESQCAAMAFRIWHPQNTLEAGPHKILQPSQTAKEAVPDLLLLPLIGFDDHGHRLGQGGGHYDRYCAQNPDAIRIALAWSVQQYPQIPVEQHDRPIDAIITEQGIITPARSRLQGSTKG